MGYRIKEVREQKRMTQEELSQKSGVSRTTISALENNTERFPSTKTILAIANALDTTVDNIFFGVTVQQIKQFREGGND